ncbi:MAG: YtxH domain-containing protein [Bacilli bacterium]|nr:YtxH domain-containing protein [Bacilli bacterium]
MSKRSIGNLFLGAAIGASLGVLFAPKKGQETRRDLKNKMLDLIDDAKELSIGDISEMIEDKITDIRHDLNDLDKEKVLKIAKEKSEEIKVKCQDLVDLAINKGTPVLQDAAIEVRDKTIDVMHDMIKKLEAIELDKKNTKANEKKEEKNKK